MTTKYIQYIMQYIMPALITGGITFFIASRTLKKDKLQIISQLNTNNKTLSLQHITDKRVDWIYTVRDELSDFISYMYFAAEEYRINKTEEKIPAEVFTKLNKHQAKLKLLFNFNGKIDRVILQLIDEISYNLCSEKFKPKEFEENIDLLTKHSQVYLKLEWDRVKLETTQNYDDTTLKKTLYERAITLYDVYKNQEKCKDCSLEFLPKIPMDEDYTL